MTGLARSNLVVAAGTAVSRLTGLARIVILGVIIGQTALADAFDSANNSPNAIYELLIGGVLSASLVSLFAQFVERDEYEYVGTKSTDAIISVAIIALLTITALAVAFSPAIFHLFSLNPAQGVDIETFRSVGTAITQIVVLQIFFYGLSALTSALLNARKLFFVAAWSPAIANLVTIAVFCTIPLRYPNGQIDIAFANDQQGVIWLLALGTTLGIATMTIIQVVAVIRHGMSFSFSPKFSHPAVRKLLTLSMWTLGYVAANQVALVVIKNLASPGSGGVDAYAKAFVLLQLPHGLLAVSIATTFVPELARMFHRGDHSAFSTTMSSGIRLTALFTIPAALGLWVLATPVVGVLFQHGNFSTQAANTTARALSGLALGLAGFSLYLFVLRGFYARNDTKTPFFLNLFENALNIVFAIVLVDRHGVFGLGIAFSLAYLISAAVALIVLKRTKVDIDISQLLGNIMRIVAAGGVMVLAVLVATSAIDGDAGIAALSHVIVGVVVGGAAYLVALRVFGESTLRDYLSRNTTRSSR